MAGLDVLIADDSEIAREALRNMVQGLGWKATAVDSGEAAVHHVATQTGSRIPVEVLLLDWKMPGMDGLAAAKAIRHELKAACDPIVIMVTAYERDELFAQADCGLADGVLNKPVTPSALYNAVSRALRLRQGGTERAPNRPRQRLAGVRILVVDDSEINREVAQRIFAYEGADIVLACDGRQAVDRLEGHPGCVDIVLMDVQMPGLNGYEATREIRLMPALRQLPIVALTAGVFQEQRELAQTAGMNGFLSKPFDVDAAIGLIIQLTGGKAGQLALEAPAAAPFAAAFSSDLPGLAVTSGLAVWDEVLVRIRTHLKVLSAERQMKKSYDRLKEAETLRDSLVHMMVHDLRSPLTVMMVSLEMVQADSGGLLPPESRDTLAATFRATQRMARMVNTVLDLSKLEAGRMSMHLQPCDLAGLLQEVVDSQRDLAGSRRLALEVPMPISVRADRDLLFRVFQNLISNAIKFTPEGKGIWIRAEEAEGWALIRFIDQGPGILPQDRERIFEKFGQVEGRGKPGWASSGLGLPFCKLAVEAHQGTLGLESAPGEGSCFLLRLPV